MPYREVFVPVDNSPHSDWALDRAIEICRASAGRITGNHVYAARLHDVRFRQRSPSRGHLEPYRQVIEVPALHQWVPRAFGIETSGPSSVNTIRTGMSHRSFLNGVSTTSRVMRGPSSNSTTPNT